MFLSTCQSIERVRSFKFLGVLIDEKLTWNDHINYIRGKISRLLGVLRCARQYHNRETLILLYYAFIYPYLSYCVDVWGCCTGGLFNSVFKLRKRAIRLITFSKSREHADPLFKSLSILPLKNIYIITIALFMFKHHHHLLPPVLMSSSGVVAPFTNTILGSVTFFAVQD